MNKGIACIGNLIVDVIKEVDVYPAAGNLATITSVSTTTGGLVCNCLLDLANMDTTVHLEAVGLTGVDDYGEIILNTLTQAGVDTSHIARKDEMKTSFTDVINHGRERTFFQYRGANAVLDLTHIPFNQIRADILHFGYILLLDALDQPDEVYGTKMAQVLAEAQKRGFKTSVDVVSEQGERFNRLVPPALKYTDYCIINEIEASATTGVESRSKDGKLLWENMESLCRALKVLGVKEWVVIHCPEGSFALDETGQYWEQPSLDLPKSEIKGKTGAGDAFCAAVLYGAYKEMPLLEALKLASAAAASCIREISATAGVLPVEALWKMVEKYGFEVFEK